MRFYPSFYSGNFFSEFLKNTLRNDALLWGLENNVNLDDVDLENYLCTTTSSETITDTLNDLHPWLKWYQLQKSDSRTTTMLRSSIGPIGYLGAYGAVAHKKCIIPKSAVCLENTF